MIVLASKSPRRKELLSLITKDFEICESHFDESSISVDDNYKLPELLAYNKAKEVASKYGKDDVIIGSDTIVLINNEVLGKPKSTEDAHRMLNLLSNKTHEVITGLSIIYGEKIINKTVIAKVHFKDLDEDEISKYIASNEPFDKAGAYAIQGLASKFIKGIEGDYFTIVGLPVNALYESLRELKVL